MNHIYSVIATAPSKAFFTTMAMGIQEARDEAVDVVHERMHAFGEDREALLQYGYLKAEAEALDMPEEGGVIALSDGWKIEIKVDDSYDPDHG